MLIVTSPPSDKAGVDLNFFLNSLFSPYTIPTLQWHWTLLWISVEILLFSGVDLSQTTFAGLTEAVVQVNTGLVHSAADHIVADVSGAG